MADFKATTKRFQIDKANQRVTLVLSAAVFITIFCIFSSRALMIKASYQSKVISGKQKAFKQLETNVKSVDSLNTAYQNFINEPTNIIGGQTNGTGDRDGDNAKIILDALPSKYDFPALTASLEKIFKTYNLNSITGSDDELNQAAAQAGGTGTQSPVPMVFTLATKGNFNAMRTMLQTLENSIRPMQVGSITVSGTDDNLTVQVAATTYYQPEKQLSIVMKDVKR